MNHRHNLGILYQRTVLSTVLALSLLINPLAALASPPGGAPPLIGPGVNHPERQWKTFETPHFRLHYYQGYEAFARMTAEIAESGFERIAQDLGVTYPEQIHLVITEDEFWNGYAEPLRNRIVLDPRFSLEPTIGLSRFVLHEMTHILNFQGVQTQQPFSRLINAAGLPSWFAEGLAQYEAEFWAPEMDRLLRMHVLNRSLLTPAERNAFILLGNRGADGYNEGYSLVKYLFDTYGHDKVAKLLKEYREQHISFDQALYLTFGKTITILEAEWRDQLEQAYQEQIRDRSASIDQAQALMPYKANKSWYQPQISPDGKWIAYLSSSSYSTIRGHLYTIMPLKAMSTENFEKWGQQENKKAVKEKAENADKTATQLNQPIPVNEASASPIPSATPDPTVEPTAPPEPELKLDDLESKLVDRLMDYKWRPDSQAIAYTTLKADAYGNSTTRVLIQKLKVNNAKLENEGDAIELNPELTTHSAAWSPDGKTLAVVLEEQGHDAIAFFDVETRQITKKTMLAPDWRQYRNLQFSPDGQSLLMEVYLPGQAQHLLKYNLAADFSEQLTQPLQQTNDRQAIWAKDSQSIYFVSTRTGFADLWHLDLAQHELKRLSQVYSGLETPSLSPDGKSLYYARHYAEGTALEKVELDKLKTFDQFKHTSGEAIFEQQVSLNPVPKLDFKPQDYLPWIGMEVLVPIVGRDEQGDQLGFLVQFGDLLQTHSFNILFLYGLASSRIGYSAAYINRFFDTAFGVEVGDSPVLSFTTDGSQYFIQRDQHISLFASRPLFNAGSGDTFATEVERFASLEFNVSKQANLTTQLNGTITPLQMREGWNNTLAFNFTDNRSRGKQRGFRYSLGVTGASKLWGSEYEFVSANADWRQYIPLWGQHTLAYFLTAAGLQGQSRPALLGGPPLSNVLVLNFQNIIPLRGFRLAELQGPLMLAGSLEYRIPLLNPIVSHIEDHYVENLHAAAFVDMGDAWYPDKRTPYPHIGAGLELRSDVIINRRNSFQLYLGAGKSLLGQGTTNYLIDRPIEFYGGFANIF